jgi:pimeloyl-ACP methyl ester carboxylesterase
LHTWSGSYLQSFSIHYANWCIDNDWVFIHPHFRGHNKRPEATGSELVIEDILSAVDYAKTHAKVSKVYLIGSSGGGYTALLMAARTPEVWTAVSSWVPITSLEDWYNQCVSLNCEEHAQDIILSCGGVPGQSEKINLEYAKRSPIYYLNPEITIPIDINAGIRDGHHAGGVGINHSLNAFNLLAQPKDVIAVEDIKYMTYNARVPEHLTMQIHDPLYCDKQPLFRKNSGNKRVTIFNGSHEMVWEAGLKWLAQQ